MNPDQIAERLRLAGETWAKANGEADRAEGMLKVVFSEIVNHYTGEGLPIGKSEHLARTHDSYRQALSAAIKARTDANLARAKLDAGRAWFDAWRTLESTKRAEMGIR